MALYIGGMGARSKNFYNDYVKRMGYEDAAVKIQDAFLARPQRRSGRGGSRQLDRRDGAGRSARTHQGPAAGLEGGAKEHRIGTLLLGGASSEALRVIAAAVL